MKYNDGTVPLNCWLCLANMIQRWKIIGEGGNNSETGILYIFIKLPLVLNSN